MSASKILVVFYSRSGTTRTVAQALAEALKCDLVCAITEREVLSRRHFDRLSAFEKTLQKAIN
jgi:flavodoxin